MAFNFYPTVTMLSLCIGSLTVAAESNCTCTHYPETDEVGPYCAPWRESTHPFCFLSGRSKARFCAGAIRWKNTSLYWSSDGAICKNSSHYLSERCNCGYYGEILKMKYVGPHCAVWFYGYPEVCYLAGRSEARFCPGASLSWVQDIYYTYDKQICEKSNRQIDQNKTLGLRQSFSLETVTYICIYSLNILIGTVGNALVIKYFSSRDVSSHPGSRFVVALAVVDFTSSIWIPGQKIIKILFAPYWPLGEFTCRFHMLFYLLMFATSWLILAISVERARAIYKPFADKLRTKCIFLVATSVLGFSFILSLKEGLSFKHAALGRSVYIDGVTYSVPFECVSFLNHKEAFINIVLVFTLGIWLPMLLIAIVNILMYLKLSKQAEIRKASSSYNSKAQLKNISKTFTIVVVSFYICYLPATIIKTLMHYILITYWSTYTYWKYEYALGKAWDITNILWFSNSTINPIIYGKVHEKIYHSIKRLLKTCRCDTFRAK